LFQSLIGSLKTICPLSLSHSTYMFQSLIGSLKTGYYDSQIQGEPGFNPS